MTTCDTAIQTMNAQLMVLHVRECELSACLSQNISRALAYYGPNIQALDDTNPLNGNFTTLYCQLAMRRIEQFQREIAERARWLNYSQAVQEALRMLDMPTVLQCDLAVNLDPDSSRSKDQWSQQINAALLHLMHCSNSLQDQLAELTRALEAWTPSRKEQAAVNTQGVNHFRQVATNPPWFFKNIKLA
ncbi:hypothetical protein SAMN04489707_105212 [Paenacidovorax caeni]|uniref:Uncharacterized protein n=2 Tax=Paenacidovorax caeni TaxID=343013 RepID=A0A1I7KHS2_9BURK|nr:hypothetical protein [Paenacidovorax caeni]SFU96987.1 hypothetical protein SAMN04489707_105212 [Paenacidovorax caeni]